MEDRINLEIRTETKLNIGENSKIEKGGEQKKKSEWGKEKEGRNETEDNKLVSSLWNNVELKTHVFSGSEKLPITNNPAIYLRHYKSAAQNQR